MNQKYILTGGPGTGKTSIIHELKSRGFYCVNEGSREIIAKQIKNRGNVLPWKNQVSFENQVANIRTKKYLSVPKNHICFFDRSIIDCIAYLKLNNIEPTYEIIKNINTCSFNQIVFYTPIWDKIYITDNERKEKIEEAKKIEAVIIDTYKSRGYKLVRIPKGRIKERADFILSKI